MSNRRTQRRFEFAPGEARLPGDFGERLTCAQGARRADLGGDGRGAGRR